MSLEIKYTLHARGLQSPDDIIERVRAMRDIAVRYRRERRVISVSRIRQWTRRDEACVHYSYVGRGENRRLLMDQPQTAWFFRVDVAHGVAPCLFGFYLPPTEVYDLRARKARRVRHRAWQFNGTCETQNASWYGEEYFIRAHTTVLQLLAAFRRVGVHVRIMDYGWYLPHRSIPQLLESLEEDNRCSAAFAGALKDLAEQAGQKPWKDDIFRHPDFERLEAEGLATFPDIVEKAREIISQRPRPRRRRQT